MLKTLRSFISIIIFALVINPAWAADVKGKKSKKILTKRPAVVSLTHVEKNSLSTTKFNKIRKINKKALAKYPSLANVNKKTLSKNPALLNINAVETSLIVDNNSGKVLHAVNSNEKIYPASLTKLMTLYLTFEAIEKGNLTLNQKLYASKNSEKAPPSKLYIKAGENITVKEAILSQITKSANDISIVLAENISGSEQKFARLMTLRARQLGMKNTFFKNASGLHHRDQKSTPIDLAKLTIALKRDYAKFYPLFSQTSFVFRGKIVKGHNAVVENYKGAEGLKTGYTKAAGYNLITTASRNGKSLIGVVTGTSSKQYRDNKMVLLLDKHFGESLVSQNRPIKRNYIIKKKIAKI